MDSTTRAFSSSGRALFLFFALVCIVSTAGLVFLLNKSFLVPTPSYGGSVSEGIIGSPRFINPILAQSDADQDLTVLLYSGLLKATPEGGYKNDLASSYEISPDGKIYTFKLKPDVTFHDGTKVTADDVLFTIAKVQDAALKSPRRGNWDGVLVEKVDDATVRFTLKSAYAPFIENTTLGIMPKHLWQGVTDEEFSYSDLNLSPVGSGPFKIGSIERSPAGIPTSYTLSAFSNFALGRPYLNSFVVRFYQSEQALVDALTSGKVEMISGVSPAVLSQMESFNVERATLNRVFGIFFNQNQSSVLRDADVRAALSVAINRTALIEQVLMGYGTPLSGPTPGARAEASSDDAVAKAQAMLTSKGWKLDQGVLKKTTGSGKNAQTVELAFSLSTGNVPELRAAAEFARQAWTSLGARVDVEVFDQGDLSQNVIRPRKYDALLFGEVIGRELDLYPFWHSSQRNDPGLNIALYANSTVDSLLEQMRATTDASNRSKLYTQFETEIKKDIPAVFLYAPDFVYSIPDDIKGLTLGTIETPSDRFLSVALWHRQTDYVWPFFSNEK